MNNKTLLLSILGLLFVLITGALGGLAFGALFGHMIGFPKLFGLGAGIPSASVFFAAVALAATAWYVKLNWNAKEAKKRKKAKAQKRKLAKKAKEAAQKQAEQHS